MKISLGFSPCPNDTFIFDALVHAKIDTEGLEFIPFIEDVETLNQKAFNHELDVTKLSYAAFPFLVNEYILLDAGSALGFGVGPLLISKKEIPDLESKISDLKIGTPGKLTTANFLLNLAFPEAKNKVELIFSEIENELLEERIDLGLIIHENRFTYQQKGLKKIMDLGEYWERETGLPIPLGGIVASRKLNNEILQKINRVLKRSVVFAFENPKSSSDFVKKYAQDMNEEVRKNHIKLYVNEYSLNLGEEGRKAVEMLFARSANLNAITLSKKLFL